MPPTSSQFAASHMWHDTQHRIAWIVRVLKLLPVVLHLHCICQELLRFHKITCEIRPYGSTLNDLENSSKTLMKCQGHHRLEGDLEGHVNTTCLYLGAESMKVLTDWRMCLREDGKNIFAESQTHRKVLSSESINLQRRHPHWYTVCKTFKCIAFVFICAAAEGAKTMKVSIRQSKMLKGTRITGCC